MSSSGRFVLGVAGATVGGYLITEGIWKFLRCRRTYVDYTFQNKLDALVLSVKDECLKRKDVQNELEKAKTSNVLKKNDLKGCILFACFELFKKEKSSDSMDDLYKVYRNHQFDQIPRDMLHKDGRIKNSRWIKSRWFVVALIVGAVSGVVASSFSSVGKVLKVGVGLIGGLCAVYVSRFPTLSHGRHAWKFVRDFAEDSSDEDEGTEREDPDLSPRIIHPPSISDQVLEQFLKKDLKGSGSLQSS